MPFSRPSCRPSRVQDPEAILSSSCRPVRHNINVSATVWAAGESISVPRGAAPYIGVGGCKYDTVGIRPVIVQAFPDASRAFSDVGLRQAPLMHFEVLVGAVAKEFRTAGSKVAERSDVLLRCYTCRPMEMNSCHVSLLFRLFETLLISSIRDRVAPVHEDAITFAADFDSARWCRCRENHPLPW